MYMSTFSFIASLGNLAFGLFGVMVFLIVQISFSTLNLFIYIFYSTSLMPCGKFGSPYLGQTTTAARAALPIPNSACGIFVCPNGGMAANAWDL